MQMHKRNKSGIKILGLLKNSMLNREENSKEWKLHLKIGKETLD